MGLQDELLVDWVEIVSACCAATPGEETSLLAKVWDTLASQPSEWLEAVLPGFPTRERFDLLLEAGASESAAISLLGSKLGYIASRSPDGKHLATVNACDAEEITIMADSLALGLAAGLLVALMAYRTQASAPAPLKASQVN